MRTVPQSPKKQRTSLGVVKGGQLRILLVFSVSGSRPLALQR